MTPEELDVVERDAREVIDGFKTPKDRHARNVLRLTALVRSRDEEIMRLRNADPFDFMGIRR